MIGAAERNFILLTPFFPEGAPASGGEQRIAAFRTELLKYGNVYTCVPHKKAKRCDCISPSLNLHRVPGRTSSRRHPFRFLVNRLSKALFGWLESWENAKTAPFATELPLERWFPGVRFDAIVMRTFEEVRLFRPWRLGIPVYVDLDDSPLESFDTRFAPHLPLWRRGISRRLFARRFRRYCAKCAGGWLADEASIKSLGLPPDRFHWLPNVPFPPSAGYRPESDDRDSLLFVGSFGYAPNVDAVAHFIGEIWPCVRKAAPRLALRIVGGGVPPREKELWEAADNVEVVGFAADLAPHYERAYASVVPMRSGSGTAIKVMESMVHERVCLASPFGARGWSPDAEGIRICKTPDEWARAVADLIGEPADARRAQERAARSTFERARLEERRSAAMREFAQGLSHDARAHAGEGR